MVGCGGGWGGGSGGRVGVGDLGWVVEGGAGCELSGEREVGLGGCEGRKDCFGLVCGDGWGCGGREGGEGCEGSEAFGRVAEGGGGEVVGVLGGWAGGCGESAAKGLGGGGVEDGAGCMVLERWVDLGWEVVGVVLSGRVKWGEMGWRGVGGEEWGGGWGLRGEEGVRWVEVWDIEGRGVCWVGVGVEVLWASEGEGIGLRGHVGGGGGAWGLGVRRGGGGGVVVVRYGCGMGLGWVLGRGNNSDYEVSMHHSLSRFLVALDQDDMYKVFVMLKSSYQIAYRLTPRVVSCF
ncbi:hypothetical protein Tco_1134381 [Tanacetum coccineum]